MKQAVNFHHLQASRAAMCIFKGPGLPYTDDVNTFPLLSLICSNCKTGIEHNGGFRARCTYTVFVHPPWQCQLR